MVIPQAMAPQAKAENVALFLELTVLPRLRIRNLVQHHLAGPPSTGHLGSRLYLKTPSSVQSGSTVQYCITQVELLLEDGLNTHLVMQVLGISSSAKLLA